MGSASAVTGTLGLVIAVKTEAIVGSFRACDGRFRAAKQSHPGRKPVPLSTIATEHVSAALEDLGSAADRCYLETDNLRRDPSFRGEGADLFRAGPR